MTRLLYVLTSLKCCWIFIVLLFLFCSLACYKKQCVITLSQPETRTCFVIFVRRQRRIAFVLRKRHVICVATWTKPRGVRSWILDANGTTGCVGEISISGRWRLLQWGVRRVALAMEILLLCTRRRGSQIVRIQCLPAICTLTSQVPRGSRTPVGTRRVVNVRWTSCLGPSNVIYWRTSYRRKISTSSLLFSNVQKTYYYKGSLNV